MAGLATGKSHSSRFHVFNLKQYLHYCSNCRFSLIYPLLWLPYSFLCFLAIRMRSDPTRKVIGPVRLFELIHIPKFIILAAWIWGLVLTVTAPLWFDDGYSTGATAFRILWGIFNGYLILGNLVMAVIWLASHYDLPSMSGLTNAFWAYNGGIGRPRIYRPPSPPPYYP